MSDLFPGLRRVAVAQTVPTVGDVAANVADHLRWMEQAAACGVDWVQFPELSLTGYAPDLLPACALKADSPALTTLSQAAQRLRLHAVVGFPLAADPAHGGAGKPWISAMLLHADGARTVYCKHHLHAGEDTFAQPGEATSCVVALGDTPVALAICADGNHPIHARRAANCGARIYSAGILITSSGWQADSAQLRHHALQYHWHVLAANYGGPAGAYVAAGHSAIWGPQGQCLTQAAGHGAALAVADLCDTTHASNGSALPGRA